MQTLRHMLEAVATGFMESLSDALYVGLVLLGAVAGICAWGLVLIVADYYLGAGL